MVIEDEGEEGPKVWEDLSEVTRQKWRKKRFPKSQIANVSTGTGFQKSLSSSFQSETDTAISAWVTMLHYLHGFCLFDAGEEIKLVLENNCQIFHISGLENLYSEQYGQENEDSDEQGINI